jgi:hypothetical protein
MEPTNVQKQEDKVVVTKAHGKEPYDRKYSMKAIGESSSGTMAATKIKWGNGFPKQQKPKHELDLFPCCHVLVGCTACYTYMMVSSSNYTCLLCHRRAHTIEQLKNN